MKRIKLCEGPIDVQNCRSNEQIKLKILEKVKKSLDSSDILLYLVATRKKFKMNLQLGDKDPGHCLTSRNCSVGKVPNDKNNKQLCNPNLGSSSFYEQIQMNLLRSTQLKHQYGELLGKRRIMETDLHVLSQNPKKK